MLMGEDVESDANFIQQNAKEMPSCSPSGPATAAITERFDL